MEEAVEDIIQGSRPRRSARCPRGSSARGSWKSCMSSIRSPMSDTHRLYRQFQEIGDFIEEIQSFEKRAGRIPAQPELFKA